MLSTKTISVVLALEFGIAGILSVVALDLVAHDRVERRPGLNVNRWGYRGPATFHKTGGERRIAMVGGSVAFGFGLDDQDSLPRRLEMALNGREGHVPTSVVNLAEVGAGAGSYAQTLEDYAFLRPDVVLVYDGYASTYAEVRGGRRASLVFRRIGYVPILTDWLRGNVTGMQRPSSVPIDVSLADSPGDEAALTCDGMWSAYCAAMIATVDWGLTHEKGAIVVTPPFLSRRHEAQQQSLARLLRQRFGANARFMYVDLGTSVQLADIRQSSDGVHLTAGATIDLAGRLARAIDGFPAR